MKKVSPEEEIIILRATRFTYCFVTAALICWIIVNLIVNKELLSVPFIIILLEFPVLWISRLYIRKKENKKGTVNKTKI